MKFCTWIHTRGMMRHSNHSTRMCGRWMTWAHWAQWINKPVNRVPKNRASKYWTSRHHSRQRYSMILNLVRGDMQVIAASVIRDGVSSMQGTSSLLRHDRKLDKREIETSNLPKNRHRHILIVGLLFFFYQSWKNCFKKRIEKRCLFTSSNITARVFFSATLNIWFVAFNFIHLKISYTHFFFI